MEELLSLQKMAVQDPAEDFASSISIICHTAE